MINIFYYQYRKCINNFKRFVIYELRCSILHLFCAFSGLIFNSFYFLYYPINYIFLLIYKREVIRKLKISGVKVIDRYIEYTTPIILSRKVYSHIIYPMWGLIVVEIKRVNKLRGWNF